MANLCKLISETTRIFATHPFHFFSLGSLFLFVISISKLLVVYAFSSFPDEVFLFICVVSARISITHSTFTAFHGRPVRFTSSLKMITVSFIPLLATFLLIGIILFLIALSFAGFALLAYNALLSGGIEMDYDSYSFLAFGFTVVALFFSLLIYLQIAWYLSAAVVVLESEWSFVSLKRSCVLVRGVKMIVLLMILFKWAAVGVLLFWYSHLTPGAGERGSRGWRSSLWVAVQVIGFSVSCSVYLLYSVATNTILYAHCKTIHEQPKVSDEEMGGVCAPRPAVRYQIRTVDLSVRLEHN